MTTSEIAHKVGELVEAQIRTLSHGGIGFLNPAEWDEYRRRELRIQNLLNQLEPD